MFHVLAELTISGETLTLSSGDLEDNYIFAQLHFHWGSVDTQGSEHTIDGNRFPLEVRLANQTLCIGDVRLTSCTCNLFPNL